MPELFMDCGSGVGAVKMAVLAQRLSTFFNLSVTNDLVYFLKSSFIYLTSLFGQILSGHRGAT